MKNLDTGTVLEIIKMIDNNVRNLNIMQQSAESIQWKAQAEILSALSNHLQDYIEGQLDATENQTGE